MRRGQICYYYVITYLQIGVLLRITSLIISLFIFLIMPLHGFALPEEEEKYDRPTNFILSTYDIQRREGRSVRISIKNELQYIEMENLTFQWYECADTTSKDAHAIQGATDIFYETPSFEEKEIRYYYCEIVQFSQEQNKALPIFIVAYTGLPIVSVDTIDGSVIWNQDEWFPSVFKSVPGETEGEFIETRIAAKGRGNSSWHLAPKNSYSLRFDKTVRPFGLSLGKHFALISNYSDKALLRNWWSGYLCKCVFKEQTWNPSYVQVEFILNGIYMGNYSFSEQIRIGQDRFNFPSIKQIYKKTHSTGGLKKGGYILEIDQHRTDGDYFFKTDHDIYFTIKEPNLSDLQVEDQEIIKNYIKKYIQELENRIICLNKEENSNRSCFEMIDIDSVVDWYLFKELSKDKDSNFYSSVFLVYDPIKEKIYLCPQWDFDLAFGNYGEGGEDSPEGWQIQNIWFDGFLQDIWFTKKVQERWRNIKIPLRTEAISALKVKSMEMSVSAEMNFERWRILGRHIWNSSAGSEDRKTYQSEVNYMLDWVIRRINWLDRMVDGL